MNRALTKTIIISFVSGMILTFVGCGDEATTPRPPGYFRIELPTKEYDTVNTAEYSFLKNQAALFRKVSNVEAKGGNYSELFYKSLKATYYFSYFEPDTNLSKLIDDCHALAYNHTGKADDIVPVKVDYPKNDVHGLIYEFKGNAATPIQFYVTDSTNNFLRGSLYFYSKPNYDSIQPVLEFVRKDLDKVLSTLKWK
jgi:gliding motility-associated lipoprotein GldD